MEPSDGQLSAESLSIVKETDTSIESTSPTNGNKLKSVLINDDNDDNGYSVSSALVTSETVLSSHEPLIKSKHSTSPTSSSGRDAKRLKTVEQVPSDSSCELPQKPLTTVIERITESPKNGANKPATSDENVSELSVSAEIKTESETVSQSCDTSSQEKENTKPESQDAEQHIEKKTSSDEEVDFKKEPTDSPSLCLFKDEDWPEPNNKEKTLIETDGGAGFSAPDDADLGRLRWTPSPKDAEMHSPKGEEIGNPDTVEGPKRIAEDDKCGKIGSPAPIPQQEPQTGLKEAKIDAKLSIKDWSPESIPDPAPVPAPAPELDQDQDMPSPGQDVPDVGSIKSVKEKTEDDEWGDSNTEKQESRSAVDGGSEAPKKELKDDGWGDDSPPVKEEKTGSDASSSKVQVADDDGWGSSSWGGSSSDVAKKDTVDSCKKGGNDDWSSGGGGDSAWGGGGSGGSFSAGKSSGSRQGKGCFKCGEEGHMSRECPSGGGGGGSRPPGKGCFKCGQEGHMSRECPNSGSSGARGKGCFKCGEEGHMSRECPSSGGSGARGKGCFKCGQEGHMSRECPNSGGGNSGRSFGSKSGGDDWGSGGGGSWGGGSSSSSQKKDQRSGSPQKKTSSDDWGSGGGGSWAASGGSSFSESKSSGKSGGKGCFKCGEEGHMSRECPTGGSRGKGCFKCGEEGHMSRECPNSGSGGGGGGSRPQGKGCFKCGQEGHMSRECPNSGSGSGGGRSFGSKSGGSDWGSGGGGSWGGDSGGSSIKKEERRTSTSTKKSAVSDWDSWETESTPTASTKETNQKSSGGWDGGQESSPASSDQKQSFWGGGQESSSSGQKKSSGIDDWGTDKKDTVDSCKKGGNDDWSSGGGGDSAWGGGGSGGSFSAGKSSGSHQGKGCFKCGEEGHMSRECPTGGGSGSKPGGKGCFKCGQEGHQAKDCTEPSLDADGKPRPPVYKNPDLSEDKALYEKVSTGVNFDRYQELPCSVSGLDVPKDPERYETFEEALKSETIRSGLEATGISRPMPIQKYGMRIVMAGRDLMACAQTGSGKTLAFMLPILQDLFSDSSTASEYGKMPQEPRALIVSPTRELALQIFKEGYKYSKDSIVKIQIIYGGTSTNHQRAKLSEGVHILVGTPGRIIDFLNKGIFNLSKLKYFVLDEADRMIDDGFLPDVRKINSNSTMPSKENRQTLMFSATFPDKVQQVAAEFLKTDYLFLTVGVLGAANADVEQILLKVEKFSKRNKLFEILGSPNSNDRIMIFVEAKKTADFLASFLSSSDFRATSIHGDRYQHQREEALRDLRSGKFPIIVATSVAARGLDIEGVRHVINYDLPKTIDEYVHRIGRTGRVGNKGKATSFYDPNQDQELAEKLVEIMTKANQEVPDWLQEEVSGGGSFAGGADFGGIDCRGGGTSTDFKDFDAPSQADAVDLEW